MLTPEEIQASAEFNMPVMFAPGDSTTMQTAAGLGNGASASWRGLGWMGVVGMAFALVM